MKKIIERAEKYLENADKTNYLMFNAAVDKYKRLSETPITKDWLKEHRWRFYTKDYWQSPDDKLAIVFITDESGWKIPGTAIRLHSLADLYDVCELCGITMDLI